MAKIRSLHRSINERWLVTGTLLLETPAHFGNGDADALTDMPLLVDEVDGKPLLPGTSIAGALRNYLREIELGYGKPEGEGSLASVLFGSSRPDEEGIQSPVIVFDAPGHAAGMELRDGVAIDPETRTAADEKKFDMQLLAAGSTFDLRFELLVSDGRGDRLREALATALHGLENREITLGTRKRRGFGQVTVEGWKVLKYDLKTKDGLLAWLASERDWESAPAVAPQPGTDLANKLHTVLLKTDGRRTAHLTATFAINGTLMIRSGFGKSDSGPDMVHLHSPRPGKKGRVPVIPGTSWAGVLRHRGLKIARTLSKNDLAKSHVFLDGLFGPSKIERSDNLVKASRVSIRESEIEDMASLVVTRIKNDRFTGGAYESALFSEQPAIGKAGTRVKLDLVLRNPSEAEIGLILLLLKDLWTVDLPIGGESGIGRGRLRGVEAILTTPERSWTFTADGEKVKVNLDTNGLEEFVGAFNKEMEKAQVEK